MRIIIAGYGFVGKAVSNSLSTKNKLHIVDPKYSTAEIEHSPYAEGIIICVGTPSTSYGGCDDSQIRNVMDKVPVHLPVLIKSTVLPDQLRTLLHDYPNHSICYSPEFLRAATASEDFANQTYMVIGGDDPEDFWKTLFQESLPNCRLIFNTSIIEASMIKYTTNCFLATKVAFFNQIYDLCQLNGADYSLVRQILTHDDRIGNSHMLVPGPDMNRGFGGACFPKDTKAFRKYAYGLNKPVTILDSAMDYNETVRKNVDNQQN
jgi:UDPglucose 6-dehydrogenase